MLSCRRWRPQGFQLKVGRGKIMGGEGRSYSEGDGVIVILEMNWGNWRKETHSEENDSMPPLSCFWIECPLCFKTLSVRFHSYWPFNPATFLSYLQLVLTKSVLTVCHVCPTICDVILLNSDFHREHPPRSIHDFFSSLEEISTIIKSWIGEWTRR